MSGKYRTLLLCLLYLVNLCHGQRECGGTEIDDKSDCLCGNETIPHIPIKYNTTYDLYYTDDIIACCGPDKCTETEDGSATSCPGGEKCKTRISTFLCGDIRLSSYNKCQCGAEQLSWSNWNDQSKFCCPSSSPSQCFMTPDGDGHCDGTVKTGREAGCETGICWNRNWFACRSGNECVTKWQICHGGEPLCQDGSDLEFCNIQNKDVCPPYFFKKCPVTSSSEHQQCYDPTNIYGKEGEFDCLTRSDEVISTDNNNDEAIKLETDNDHGIIDYESIKPCNDTEFGLPGLMCGNECLANTEWCRIEEYSPTYSCKGNTSTFTTDNSVLCMNSSFWSQNGQDCRNYNDGDIIEVFSRRCTGGRVQHCYSPLHRSYNYDTSASSCSDSSDQIHPVGSKCNIEQDVQEFCQTFCPTDKQILTDEFAREYFIDDDGRKVRVGVNRFSWSSQWQCDTICQNQVAWISSLIDPELKDPRKCQSSCADKSYNCDACTHPDYSFTCNIGGVEHCLNPDLICDGVPICDDASDEKALTPGCAENIAKEKEIKTEAATVICQRSKLFESVETIAVLCNNIVECANGEDEPWLCKNSHYSFVGMFVALIILFIISIFMKYCKRTSEDRSVDNMPLNLPDILNSEVFNREHDKKDFKDDVNLFIQKCKVTDKKEVRIEKNKKLYELELKKHNGNVAETALCIKNTIDPANSKILIEDAFPGIIRRYAPQIEDLQDFLDKRKTSYLLMNKVKNISSIYIDICKDSCLLFVMLVLVGGPTALYNFPTNFSSVVVFCQFGSIVIPLIISGILHANDEIRKSKKDLSLVEKILKYTWAIVKSPITPMFLAQAYEDNKTSRKTKIHFNRNRNDILKMFTDGASIRQSYAKFIRVDLGLEMFFQISGQLIYLMLTITTTKTTAGLETLFNKSNMYFFVLNILLGLRTIYFAYLKTVSIEKPHLPTSSKIVLFLWIMVSGTLRLMVILLYFTPSFGLFSTLGHWRMEQIPFAERYWNQIEKDGILYLYKTNITKEQWNEIDRYNYTTNNGPHYSEYTGCSLKEYFLYFWIILFVHVIINIIIKAATSKPFRKCGSLLEMMIHGLENVNMPTTYRDWDQDKGNIEDHKRRHTKVLVEMILMVFIRAVFHSIMLIPILIIATNVWKRHHLLEQTIGYLPLEQHSYENITTLFYIAVVLIPVLTILELIFYLLYQCKAHPWRDILAEHKETKEDSHNDDQETDEREMAVNSNLDLDQEVFEESEMNLNNI